MNKQNLILLVIVVLLISIFGIVIAQEGGGVLEGEGDLVVELNNLTNDLVLEGYDWLINYSIEEDFESVDVEVYLEGGDEVVAVISNVSSEGFYRSYLDGSSGAGLGRMVNGSWVGVLDNEGNVVNESEVFDLKIVVNRVFGEGGVGNLTRIISGVIFDWIVDPSLSLFMQGVSGSYSNNVTVEVNFSHLEISDVAPYDSLVGYWPFDIDVDTKWVDGVIGNAREFDGEGDWVNVGTLPISGYTEITYSLWFKADTLPTNARPINTFYSGNDDITIYFYAGRMYGRFDDGTVSEVNTSFTDTTSWHHTVMKHNGTDILLYLDGVEVGTPANDPSFNWTGIGGLTTIGVDSDLSSYSFNGSIDEVLIFNRSLTSTEITDLYNAQSTGSRLMEDDSSLVSGWRMDEGGGDNASDVKGVNDGLVVANGTHNYYDWTNENNDGVSAGNPVWDSSGVYGGALEFDGVGDYVEIDNDETLNITEGISILFWVNPKEYSGSANPFLGKWDGGGTASVLIRYSGNTIQFFIRNSSDSGESSLATSSGEVPALNEWTMVTAIYNGTDRLIYFNTDLNASGSYSQGINAGTSKLYIGSRKNTGNFFNGSIDEVMIFNTSLTAQQITDIYNNQSARFKVNGTQELKQFNMTLDNPWIRVEESEEELFGSSLQKRVGEWSVDKGYNNSDFEGNNGLVGYWHFDGNATDSSGNGNDGTVVGVTNVSGVYNGSYLFDPDTTASSGTYKITTPGLLNTNPYGLTVSVWIYPLDSSANQLFIQGTNPIDMRAYHSGDDITLTMTNLTSVSTATNRATALSWHHIVTMYNGTNSVIFVDGSQEGIVANTNSSVNTQTSFYIGSSLGWSSNDFQGSIDEVMIFNRSLSATEINELYIKGRAKFEYSDYQDVDVEGFSVNQSSTNFILNYKFNAGNGTNPFYSPLLMTSKQSSGAINFSEINNSATTCANLTIAGQTYTLGANVVQSSNADCMIIQAANVTLNCAGYSISSSYNISGVYSNQVNTTVKNCNISVGSGGNAGALGIEMTNVADYSSVINNTIIGEMDYGIYFGVSSNGPNFSLIENNTINVSAVNSIGGGIATTGIYLRIASNNILRGNNVITLGEYGILLAPSSDNNLLINNIVTTNSSWGIYMDGADNNNFTSNNVTSTSGYAFYLGGSSNNNIFSFNTGTSTSSYGIYLASGSNNNFTSNNFISTSGYAMRITGSNNNFNSNTITSTSSYGIVNTLTSNNIFTNTNVSGTYGIYFDRSDNIIFKDCINVTGSTYSVYAHSDLDSINNTFINCSYDNSKEQINGVNELIRKWYYRAYVNDSDGNNVLNANVRNYDYSEYGGLVGLWRMNNDSAYGENDTHVFDYSGNGNNASWNGVMNGDEGPNSTGLFSGSNSAGSMMFDGIDDNNALVTSSGLPNNYSEYTSSLWMKRVGASPASEFLLNPSGTKVPIVMYYGNMACDWANISGTVVYVRSTQKFNDSLWHNVLCTYNGTDILMYVDNVLQSDIEKLTGELYTFSSEIVFGSGSQYDSTPFNGSIDEVAIYNRSLSASEVQELYYLGAEHFNLTTNSSGYTEENVSVVEYVNTGGTKRYWGYYNVSASKSGYSLLSHVNNITTLENDVEDNFEFNASEGASQVDFCGVLNTAGQTYVLSSNVSSAGTCFTVSAANVTIDCAGYEINYSYSGTVGYGVYSNQFNTTVRNCVVVEGVATTNSKDGIYYNGDSADNGTIYNNTITTIGRANGVLIYGGDYNNISNNNIKSNQDGYEGGVKLLAVSTGNVVNNNFINITGCVGAVCAGLELHAGPYGNYFNNNTIYTVSNGILFYSTAYDNVFKNINIITSYRGIAQISSANRNNTIIDSVINNSGTNDVYIWANSASAGDTLTLINVTFNKSDVSINDADFTLINQYYFDVQVNSSSGVALENANVTITNNSAAVVYTALTNSTGGILRQNLTEYIETNASGKTYDTNYTVTAVLTDYVTDTSYINLTSNYVHNASLSASLYNRSSLGLTTGKVTVNYNEDVNLTIDIPNENLGGGTLSSVWAEIVRPDSANVNVSLSGNSNGGNWSATYTNPSILGNYNLTFKANLSTSVMLFETVGSNFTVQNTSIVINSLTNVNTTDTVNVNGTINRTNSTDFWNIADNLFLIKLNDVTVSSDTYNDSEFSGGTAVGTNVSSVVNLNLTSPGSGSTFSDLYGDNPTDAVDDEYVYAYNDVGYSSGVVFDLNQMTGSSANVTYKFTTLTEFYNASVGLNTGSADVSGGNVSLWYSYDYTSWTYLNSTTTWNDNIVGTVPVDGYTEFYVKITGEFAGGENPVNDLSMNYTNYVYDSIGNYTSAAINLANVTYTILGWTEDLNGQDVTVQLRESDDGSSWDAWGTNYTNSLTNDISSFTKSYLQYRAWFNTTNTSLTPILSEVNISYFNASTDSSGAYNYNITIPTNSLGPQSLNISVVQNPTTGIVGYNTTTLNVWARTTPLYTSTSNYSGSNTNHSVSVNFTRNDTAALVNGSFNVTISNSSGSLNTQTCSGGYNCVASWLLPTNLSYGNYTVNVSVWNESAYYINSTTGFIQWLEQKNTTGTLNALNKTIGDFTVGIDYEFDMNVTLNNTGNASMNDVNVYYFDPATSSGITNITEVTACSRVYPNSTCNATMRVTVDGGAASGDHRISWRANWTDNDGSVAGGSDFISYQDMYVIISLNASMAVTNSTVNKTIQHGVTDNFTFYVQATGTDNVADVSISFVEGNISVDSNISSSWINFSTTFISGIVAGANQSLTVNITPPLQTAPGNYSGIINVSSTNAGDEQISLTLTVPTNTSWYFAPTTNLTYNNSFGLNTAGDVANYTFYNLGNINLTLGLAYSNSRTTDYTGYGTSLFEVDDTASVPGSTMNPSSVNVTKGSNTNITLYQKGDSSAVDDVGIDLVITNSTATPVSASVQEAFWIFEMPPEITNVLFLLDDVNGSKAEMNKNLTIKIRATDDIKLNLTTTTVNVTYGATTQTLNASDLCSTFGECVGGATPTVANYTANFTPSTTGTHGVVVTVYDAYGQSTTSSMSNFTVYGTTTLNLAENVSSIDVSSIDKTTSYNFTVNYSINNSGEVYGYAPNLTFSKNDSYITLVPTYNLFSDLASDGSDYNVFSVGVSPLTPVGVYNITGSLGWINPSLGTDSDSVVLSINVSANRSFSLSPSDINLTVVSSASNNSNLTITNTGNADLSSINISCSSGTLCSSFTFLVNDSAFSVSSNGSTVVNVNLTAPAGLSGGYYTGVLNISGTEITQTMNIYSTVPSTYSWTASPLTVNSTKAISSSGDLSAISIQNTGNMNLTIALASTNSSIITPNVSSLFIPIATNRTFMINYTAPSAEMNSFANISMSNASATPVQLNVSVNLTSTQANVTLLYPTTASPLADVVSGDTIEVHANATYQGSDIISGASWDIDIGGGNCTVDNSTYVVGFYWLIYCTAPSITDGISHNLTITMNHATYGEISDIQVDAIAYRDATAPAINITRNNVTLGGNINLQVNVTDSVSVDTVLAYVTYPNSTIVNLTLSSSGGYYINNTIVMDVAGEYSVNYTANDSAGNTNSTVDWFEVYDRYNWDVQLTNYDGTGISDVNISLYRPSSILLLSNVTNSTGGAILNINKRNYDVHAKISADEVVVRDVNFTNVSLNNISFNIYRIAADDVTEVVTLYEPFIGIAGNTSGFSTNNISAVFNYSGYSYDNPLELGVVKCSVWNYTERVCSGSWSALSSSRNTDLKTVTGNSIGFSAYFLAENKCGNGLCESTYGETTSTCSADCAAAGSTTTVVSGGGGGGGGVSSATLAKIEELIKSFLDVGGVKLETTSIYKELFAGDTSTFRIKVTNSLAEEKTITLDATGDMKDMLFFESSTIVLEPSQKRDVLIRIVAPKLIETGNYDGDLVVKSGEDEGKIPVTIRILSPEGKLLDVKIQALKQTVAPGDILRLQLDLLNLGKTKKVDVQFDLQLLDPETGEIITRAEEAFAVETTISTVKNITIPDYVKPGKYMIKGTAYYSNVEQSMQASSITYVNVQYDLLSRKFFGIKVWVYLMISLVILLVAGALVYFRWLSYRKKRFKVKIEFNKLPNASSHSAFAGKIAETDVRAFVDMNKLQMHSLIAGSTGSGKTVAAQGIIEAALLHKKGVIVFDPTAQWTGFLRKCEDKKMLGRYKFFNMKTKEAKGFSGSIKTIHDPYEIINIKKYLNRPGEITIFNVSHLSPKEIDVVVASTIQQIFESEPEEAAELNTLIVYDEVHRLLPKFGGSGEGFVQIERGAREFRKWGIGLVLISQVLSDFVGEIKANIGTEIQMGTRYEGDLERVKMKYGEDVLKSVVKESIGTGMIVNAEYNSGRPYFIAFRPLLHSTKRLSNPDLVKYEKYFDEVEDLDYQVEQLKALNFEVLDLELELKLAKSKVREGQFQMSDMYLESLRPRFIEAWKNLGKEPMHIVKKIMKKQDIIKGVAEAKKGRESYIKKNPQEVLSLDEEVLTLKKLLEEKKKAGVDTSKFEISVKSFDDRLKPFKGKVPEDDAKGITEEIKALKGEIEAIKVEKKAVDEAKASKVVKESKKEVKKTK